MSLSYVLSQVFIVVAYSLFAVSYMVEKRRTVLWCSSVSLGAEFLGYILLSAGSGVAMVIVAIFRNILFFAQDKLFAQKSHLKQYEWVSLAVVLVLALVLAVVTYDNFFSTFAIISGMIYTYSIWQKNAQAYKYLGIIACLFLAGYNLFIGSLFGVVLELGLLVWIVLTTFASVRVTIEFRKKKVGEG